MLPDETLSVPLVREEVLRRASARISAEFSESPWIPAQEVELSLNRTNTIRLSLVCEILGMTADKAVSVILKSGMWFILREIQDRTINVDTRFVCPDAMTAWMKESRDRYNQATTSIRVITSRSLAMKEIDG